MAGDEAYDMPVLLPGDAADDALLEMLGEATRAVRANPKSAMRRCNRAFLLLRLGRREEALEDADEAARAEPGSADAHIVRGMAMYSLGRVEGALQSFDRAIEIDPADADARNNRASMLMALGRHGEAGEELDRAVEAGQEGSGALANRGRALHRLGHDDEAIVSLRRATAVRPGDASAWFDLGAILFQTGSVGESLEAFEKAIGLRPGHARAHHARGMALHYLGRLDEADASFRRAHGLDRTFVRPRLPEKMDDIYVAWHEARDTRDRLASPTGPRHVLRHHVQSRIAEFLNAARRVLDYHEKRHKSDIVKDYHGLETNAKKYLQYVNETKHERLLDVRITKTGKRKRVYPDTHTGQPMITIEEGAKLVRDGRSHGIDTWPDDMFKGDIDRGFVYEEQVCHVVLEDGEVELVEFLDTILEGVKGLLEKHGYDTSTLSDAGAYYGES